MSESIEIAGTGEAWRCTSCGVFMYNVRSIDGRDVPVEGAPQSKFFSTEHPQVCNVCWFLRTMISNLSGPSRTYWEKIIKEKEEKQAQNKKLRSGENYLGT